MTQFDAELKKLERKVYGVTKQDEEIEGIKVKLDDVQAEVSKIYKQNDEVREEMSIMFDLSNEETKLSSDKLLEQVKENRELFTNGVVTKFDFLEKKLTDKLTKQIIPNKPGKPGKPGAPGKDSTNEDVNKEINKVVDAAFIIKKIQKKLNLPISSIVGLQDALDKLAKDIKNTGYVVNNNNLSTSSGGVGGSVSNINDILDVVVALPENGQILAYNSSSLNWENKTIDLDTGITYYDIIVGEMYIVYGIDEAWEAIRYSQVDETTGLQMGLKPTTLVELQALIYS